MIAALRISALVAIVLASSSCGSHTSRTLCAGESDQTTCAQNDRCVWMNQAYVCATPCGNANACASGRACKTGAASSCATCQDLIDVCE